MIIYRNSKIKRMDTFRELLSLWEERGYCELRETDSPFCWANAVGDVLLFDYPQIEMLPNEWNHGLFSNQQAHCDKCHSWIFWSRRPRLLEKSIESGIPSYAERNIKSIFLGKVENHVQLNVRTQADWSKVVELFSMPVLIGDTQTYPYTQEEYLEKVKQSKFGLVLPGYGPKCNREIEYLGLGTVPIFTPNTDTKYHESLVRDEHFLFAETEEEFMHIVNTTDEKTWSYLSNNCREWYNRNASCEGSFQTTKRILETL